MVIYVPGTEETDPKKQNMSLQQLGAALTAAIANIATNTAKLAALTGSPISASLGANVTMNNTANYFDGPSVAQGTSGTWFASGNVTLSDITAATFLCKLWDGTTIIDSSAATVAANGIADIHLSGYLASPTANIKISCRDLSTTTGIINANASGNSKDSTITAYRIA